ncbi:MAG: Lrp/AsnC family transcriptional regulator [Oscillospiraceae bacterium]|nr:Lrp/AsnC family transcriptional regulator [Ruminococcus sp.]MBQ7003885.1 Lrp/AsnC family transcriptional regulator [Oscillospiraceae bacterium]MBQ7013406.1 Lrp/AsnC family transcriptional regulator [Oscillospiraceae bacterium]
MNELLHLLKQNARLTNAQLADMLGTTEAAVMMEIQRMEAQGIIRGYSAIINEELARTNEVEAIIELRVTPKRDCGFDEIAKTIMMYDEVESLSLMSGSYDLSICVKGSTLKEVALFVSQRLSALEGVVSTATSFVLKRYKEKGILIDEEEKDERSLVCP